MKGTVYQISASDAWAFLKPRHYAGRKPQITKAFGWYINGELVAVVTYGKPASNTLCDGICGKEYSKNVYELNRLCRSEDLQEPLSQFVSACLRRVRHENWIVVSYSDTAMCHHGYIYQACNFRYTGCTKQRTEQYTEGNKHSRHIKAELQGEYRKVRTAKHRYVFFATANKRLKQAWEDALNYPVLPFPKGENKNYTLGVYQQPIIIRTQRKEDEYDCD